MKFWWIAGGVGFFSGFMLAWIIGLADPELDKERIATAVDTICVQVTDTIRETDSFVIPPKIIHRSRIVRDTSGMDSLRAIIEELREYVAEKTFQDSAWVKHTWRMTPDWMVRENVWDYRPAQQREIYFRDTVEVKPKAAKKILYGAGMFAAGGMAALIYNNNK